MCCCQFLKLATNIANAYERQLAGTYFGFKVPVIPVNTSVLGDVEE
jgi:hypothetical protein